MKTQIARMKRRDVFRKLGQPNKALQRTFAKRAQPVLRTERARFANAAELSR